MFYVKRTNYKLLSVIQKYSPKTNFIISGDYNQHKPVKDRIGDRNQSFYQNSNVLYVLCKGNRLLLSTCRRSDNKLFNLYSDVKALTGKEFGNKFTNHHICYTNKKELK